MQDVTDYAFSIRLGVCTVTGEIWRHVIQGSDVALRVVKLVNRGWLLKTSCGKTARNGNREKYLKEVEVNAPS
jgi:hypothetical protein